MRAPRKRFRAGSVVTSGVSAGATTGGFVGRKYTLLEISESILRKTLKLATLRGIPGTSTKLWKSIFRFAGIGREPCRSVCAALNTWVLAAALTGRKYARRIIEWPKR